MGAESQLIILGAARKIATYHPEWANTWTGAFPTVQTLPIEIAHDSSGNALKGYQMPSNQLCELICKEVHCTFWNFFQEHHHSSTGMCVFTGISNKVAHILNPMIGFRRRVKSTWGCRP